MRISFKAVFLIVAASVVFHVSLWQIFTILFGYTICEYADQHQSNKAKQAWFEYETSGWTTDPKDPTHEEKGNLTRVKLSDPEQIIVTRVGRILLGML